MVDACTDECGKEGWGGGMEHTLRAYTRENQQHKHAVVGSGIERGSFVTWGCGFGVRPAGPPRRCAQPHSACFSFCLCKKTRHGCFEHGGVKSSLQTTSVL